MRRWGLGRRSVTASGALAQLVWTTGAIGGWADGASACGLLGMANAAPGGAAQGERRRGVWARC